MFKAIWISRFKGRQRLYIRIPTKVRLVKIYRMALGTLATAIAECTLNAKNLMTVGIICRKVPIFYLGHTKNLYKLTGTLIWGFHVKVEFVFLYISIFWLTFDSSPSLRFIMLSSVTDKFNLVAFTMLCPQKQKSGNEIFVFSTVYPEKLVQVPKFDHEINFKMMKVKAACKVTSNLSSVLDDFKITKQSSYSFISPIQRFMYTIAFYFVTKRFKWIVL